MNKIKKIIILLLKGISAFFLLLLIALFIVFSLNIRMELSFLNKPVELAVEKLLNRDLLMNGDVVLAPTLWPTLEIRNVSLSNPKESRWKREKVFAHFGQLRLQLGLTPLLAGEIHVANVVAKNITLNLETDSNGEANWVFALPTEETPAPAQEPAKRSERTFHFEALDSIVFSEINVNYYDQSLNKHFIFDLHSLKGEAPVGQKIKLDMKGQFQKKSFSLKLEAGELAQFQDKEQKWPLSMHIIVAGTNIKLSGALQRGKKPELQATLDIGKTDVGATLGWLHILEGLDLTSEKLTMTTKLHGRNLTEILTEAQLSIVLKNAQWNITDKNTGGVLPIKISQATIKVEPEKAVDVQIDGLLANSNVNISITGAPAIDYIRENAKRPLKLLLSTQDINLTLETQLSKAMNVNNMGFTMVFKGNDLSNLNALTRMDLPPLGPYKLEGHFGSDHTGYRIKDLLLTVKESKLKGNITFNTQAKPPQLNVDLISKKIQIDDFDVGEWSPVAKADNEKAKKSDLEKEKTKEKARKLLSRDTLSRFNAAITLEVDQVLSGKDVLGNGLASIKQENAKFDLNIEKLTLPGGNAIAYFSYEPLGTKQINTALRVKVKEFDYGILARRIDEKSKVGGKVSLDVNLSSKNAGSLNALLTQSQGHIDFAWAPKALNADLFEMWTVNLMTSLLKKTDEEKASKVNCVIGRFVMDQGMMHDKVVFVDTTKMRMTGMTEANFKKRTIKVKLTPNAKRPEFFSLATPVELSGTFDNFGISVNPLGVTETAVSFITSPLHVPVRRIFVKDLPENGHEACRAMWDIPDQVPNEIEEK